MKIRLLYHFAFWFFFVFLFWQQNVNASTQDFLAWFVVLGVAIIVVYVNLYVLFPKLFFKKRYILYSLFLFLSVFFGSLSLKIFLHIASDSFKVTLFQDFINLSFFIVITSSLKFLREFLRKQELLIKAENEQLKTEISLLKSQVNPHFLFNTLNNLYGLILQKNTEQAAEITLKLSDLMRYVLDSSKTEKVSLAKEILFLQDYLALERIRLAQQANIRFEISGLENDVFIAPLLFIPLVENAFKHGLQSLSSDGFAYFSMSVQGNEIFFEAQNSVGKTLPNQSKSGTGLHNLRKRLELMYPQKHFLEIECKEAVFKVILQIQL